MWTSAIVLYGLFWFLYIFHLALKLLYPLKSAKLDNSNNSKRNHIIEVCIVFIIGTTPFIAFAGSSKYEVVRLPPIFCGYNTTYMFYATILPTITIGSGGLALMLLVLYKLHIVSVSACCCVVAMYSVLYYSVHVLYYMAT